MAKQRVQIGSVIKDVKDGKERFFIGLGRKGKKEQYNYTVELVVKDSKGNVVAKQTDGFINLVNPRTRPDELLSAGIISEDLAVKMKEDLSKLPEKIKFQLELTS